MTPPRASNQESLWHPDVWVLGSGFIYRHIDNYLKVFSTIVAVDQAILKMMGKCDE